MGRIACHLSLLNVHLSILQHPLKELLCTFPNSKKERLDLGISFCIPRENPNRFLLLLKPTSLLPAVIDCLKCSMITSLQHEDVKMFASENKK